MGSFSRTDTVVYGSIVILAVLAFGLLLALLISRYDHRRTSRDLRRLQNDYVGQENTQKRVDRFIEGIFKIQQSQLGIRGQYHALRLLNHFRGKYYSSFGSNPDQDFELLLDWTIQEGFHLEAELQGSQDLKPAIKYMRRRVKKDLSIGGSALREELAQLAKIPLYHGAAVPEPMPNLKLIQSEPFGRVTYTPHSI